MEFDYDNSIIINLEHAYAAADMKREEFEELTIKTEEVSIKTEPNDEFENYENVFCCDNQMETVDVKPVVTDDPLNIKDRMNIDLESNSLVIDQFVESDKYILIEKEALEHLKSELFEKNQAVIALKKTSRTTQLENKSLKQDLNELQTSTLDKIEVLMNQNRRLQKEAEEYEAIKKNYKFLEDQMGILTSKMLQFMSNTLPNSDGELKLLRSKIEIKDRQYQQIGQKVENLLELINALKTEITSLTIKNKTNLLKATKRADDLETRIKKSISLNESREKKYKKFEDNMISDRLKLEEMIKTNGETYKKMKIRYKQSLIQRDAFMKHIDKLKNKLQTVNSSLVTTLDKYESTILELNQAKEKIEELDKKQCEYCGL